MFDNWDLDDVFLAVFLGCCTVYGIASLGITLVFENNFFDLLFILVFSFMFSFLVWMSRR